MPSFEPCEDKPESQEILSSLKLYETRLKEEWKVIDARREAIYVGLGLENWLVLRNDMQHAARDAKKVIRLNVGGIRFQTSRDTLLSQTGTFFYYLIATNFIAPSEQTEEYYIDRSPAYFTYILDYLRQGLLPIDTIEKELSLHGLAKELKFYMIPIPEELRSISKKG